jgi:hypothetical protein
MTGECTREEDVLDALAARRWPDRSDAELRAHVASCGMCADLVEVAAALLDDREQAWREARVPPSGVVWWRAQLRAREDAARAAGRPLAFIQGIAASVALWLVVTLVRAVPPAELAAWRAWAGGLVPSVTITIGDVASLVRVAGIVPIGILCLLAAWLMLAPIAIYFAAADE